MSAIRIATLLGALALCVGLVPAARAHAFLDRAEPAVGSSVRESPAEVRLWFSQEIEPAFSTVRVMDGNAKQVDKGDKRVESSDHMILQVSLPPLPPGTYRVAWRVVSVDTHVTVGNFTFEVRP
jgi:methionine-rich copper-binding protein CopC